MIFPPWLGFPSFCILSLSCISYHVIMCIAFAYVFVSCIRAFSPLSILQSADAMFPGIPFYLFFRVLVSNFLVVAAGLTCGLGLLPADRLSSFVSFGVRLAHRRLTDQQQR